ncbi:MAG: hypothetical protein CMJ34_01890 [Phycisphaerae bacterium]|nr:hypothetical protein [Phycisphaerae bacterium]
MHQAKKNWRRFLDDHKDQFDSVIAALEGRQEKSNVGGGWWQVVGVEEDVSRRLADLENSLRLAVLHLKADAGVQRCVGFPDKAKLARDIVILHSSCYIRIFSEMKDAMKRDGNFRRMTPNFAVRLNSILAAADDGATQSVEAPRELSARDTGLKDGENYLVGGGDFKTGEIYRPVAFGIKSGDRIDPKVAWEIDPEPRTIKSPSGIRP